jgi:hypothetical protein
MGYKLGGKLRKNKRRMSYPRPSGPSESKSQEIELQISPRASMKNSGGPVAGQVSLWTADLDSRYG